MSDGPFDMHKMAGRLALTLAVAREDDDAVLAVLRQAYHDVPEHMAAGYLGLTLRYLTAGYLRPAFHALEQASSEADVDRVLQQHATTFTETP